MKLVNVEGKTMYYSKLESITSIPLRNYPKGLYFVIVRDEKDRLIRKKILV